MLITVSSLPAIARSKGTHNPALTFLGSVLCMLEG